jgi:hypothetical protein
MGYGKELPLAGWGKLGRGCGCLLGTPGEMPSSRYANFDLSYAW